MSHSAQVVQSQSIETFIECIEDRGNYTVTGLGDYPDEDWVSLLLNEPGLEVGAGSPVALPSLSEFPLVDPEDSSVDFTSSLSSHSISANLSSICSTLNGSSSDSCFDDFFCAFEKLADPNAAAATGQSVAHDEFVINHLGFNAVKINDSLENKNLSGSDAVKINDSLENKNLSSSDAGSLDCRHIPIEIEPMETPFDSQDQGYFSLGVVPSSVTEPCSSGSSSSLASPPPWHSEEGLGSGGSLCGSNSSAPQLLQVSNNETNKACFTSISPDSRLTQRSNGSSLALHGAPDLNIAGLGSRSNDGNCLALVDGPYSGEGGVNAEERVSARSDSRQSGTEMQGLGDLGEKTCHGQAKLEALQDRQVYPMFANGPADRSIPAAPEGPKRKRKMGGRKSRSSSPDYTTGESPECSNNGASGDGVGGEDEEKRQARLMRNRESAQLSRQRKKIYIDELEERIKTMASTIAELNNTISLISAENINMRRQLGCFYQTPGSCGKSGAVPVAVPWVPVGAYPAPAVGGRLVSGSSQVPLIPIPRLKTQPITTVRKSKKCKSDGGETGPISKSPKRLKKTAGVAAMGFLFLFVLLLPFNWNFLGLKALGGGRRDLFPGDWNSQTGHLVARAGGRVLTSWNEGESLKNRALSVQEQKVRPPNFDSNSETNHENKQGSYSKSDMPENDLHSGGSRGDWQKITGCCNGESGSGGPATEALQGGSVLQGNTSGPLAATLFVPRNDRLVKMDGNLIIHSILACDKAAQYQQKPSRTGDKLKSKGLGGLEQDEKGVALAADLKALALKVGKERSSQTQEMGSLIELGRALTANSKISQEEGGLHSDASLQEWFVEGLAGPILSSGKCTEVFQFETSGASASPHSSTTGFSAASTGSRINEYLKNDTDGIQEQRPRRSRRQMPSLKHRRVSYAVPLPPAVKDATSDDSKTRRNGTDPINKLKSEEGFTNQKASPSTMVVSVLAGPAESGDEARLSGGSKGISKFFVVVLIDSVKYVTYSCMLPSGSHSHSL